MKATNKFEITGHNRTIKVTEIPTNQPGDLSELTIQITYTKNTNEGAVIDKAIALDTHVIPAIIKALNTRHRRRK